jgi:hypothetical protein
MQLQHRVATAHQTFGPIDGARAKLAAGESAAALTRIDDLASSIAQIRRAVPLDLRTSLGMQRIVGSALDRVDASRRLVSHATEDAATLLHSARFAVDLLLPG